MDNPMLSSLLGIGVCVSELLPPNTVVMVGEDELWFPTFNRVGEAVKVYRVSKLLSIDDMVKKWSEVRMREN